MLLAHRLFEMLPTATVGFESVRRLLFVSHVGSAGCALLQAPRHGNRFTLPVDLGVMLAQPCVSEYGGVPAELRHRE